jgi:hypothetical protein
LPSQGGMLSVALSHAWFESALADMPVIYGKADLVRKHPKQLRIGFAVKYVRVTWTYEGPS